jgi:hypothetical protein
MGEGRKKEKYEKENKEKEMLGRKKNNIQEGEIRNGTA